MAGSKIGQNSFGKTIQEEEALINPTFSTWGNSGIESDAGISSLMKY